MSQGENPRVLIGVTGSIAAYKVPELCREFRNRGAEVAVVMTEAATRSAARRTPLLTGPKYPSKTSP